MLQIPIFHVNGEDPEAVCQVVDLAVDFRQRFHRDVIIELWCYRKLGHNEGDEPSYTQPVMYRAIAAKPSIRMAYLAYDAANPAPGGEATDHRRGDRRDRRRASATTLEAELDDRDQAAGAAAPQHVRGRLGAHQGRAATARCPRCRPR